MARFYKTSQPESIDFMYQLPQQVMMGAIQMNDAQIDNQYQQAALLNDKLMQIKYLEPDRERTQEIINNYQSQVDELTKNLQSNPTKWRNQLPVIRDLGRKLDNDFNRGEIAGIQGNYNIFQQWDTASKDLLKNNKITPEQYEKAKAKFLGDFATNKGTAYDPIAMKGNTISTENLYENIDLNKLIRENTDKIKANASDTQKQTVNIGGQFITTTKYKIGDKWVSDADVAKMALNTVLGDEKALGWLQQGSRLGYLNGVYDNNGNFINPIIGVNPNGTIKFNPDSYLTPAIEAATLREGFYEKTRENDQSYDGANPFTLQKQKAELDDINDRKKYYREHPIEPVSSLIVGQNKQILDPKEFNLPTINQTLSSLETKLKIGQQLTTPELTQYNNLKKAKENIEVKAKEIMLKAGMTEAEFERYKPYLNQNFDTPKSKDPAGLFRVDKNISELNGQYDPKIWKPVLVKQGGNGFFGVKASSLYTFELTDEGKKMKQLSKKYSSTQDEITKLIQDQNTYTTPYFAINPSPVEYDDEGNPKPKSNKTIGDGLFDLGIALLNTNDAKIVDPTKNPEWSQENIRLVQKGRVWDSNKGAVTSLKDLSTVTGIPKEVLFTPIATTPMGGDNAVQYTINYAALEKAGYKLEDSKTGKTYNKNPELISSKTNANPIIRKIFGDNVTPDINRVLDRDNETFNYIETNISTMYKNYGQTGLTGDFIPKSFVAPGATMKDYIVTINNLNDDEAQFTITDNKSGQFRTFPAIKAGMDAQGNYYMPQDIISNQITNILEYIEKENLKERYNSNTK